MSNCILALESSCDETAVAIIVDGRVVASEISSQIAEHAPYGGVVPELASRNHIIRIRPLVEAALQQAGMKLEQIDAFAATAGPGLASSLLIGNTLAKSLAVAMKKPYLSINHIEGHLLSPFLGDPKGIRPSIGLVVSGGHTLLVHVKGFQDYHRIGQTRDDAAGEAFDKVGKMLGLPYPGGPEIDKRASSGNCRAFTFPRSMMEKGNFEFSFSGLKTAVLYALPKLEGELETHLNDLCASFQEAVVEVLVKKSIRAAHSTGESLITVSGGVSCNRRLRDFFTEQCEREGLELLLASPILSTDNAAMIAFVAELRYKRRQFSEVTEDVNPNLAIS